jgi:hypothetical protein
MLDVSDPNLWYTICYQQGLYECENFKKEVWCKRQRKEMFSLQIIQNTKVGDHIMMKGIYHFLCKSCNHKKKLKQIAKRNPTFLAEFSIFFFPLYDSHPTIGFCIWTKLHTEKNMDSKVYLKQNIHLKC